MIEITLKQENFQCRFDIENDSLDAIFTPRMIDVIQTKLNTAKKVWLNK